MKKKTENRYKTTKTQQQAKTLHSQIIKMLLSKTMKYLSNLYKGICEECIILKEQKYATITPFQDLKPSNPKQYTL